MAKGTVYLIAAFVAVAGGASAQSDFDEYVASIRSEGMTERAAGDVRMAAGILSGNANFKATRAADGSLGRSYGGPDSPEPASLDELRARRDRAAARESWSDFLQVHADADGSGFVSTKEGLAIRRIVETAVAAVQLKITSIDEMAKLVSAADLEEDLAAYAALRTQALKEGLDGIPALPEGLLPGAPAK